MAVAGIDDRGLVGLAVAGTDDRGLVAAAAVPVVLKATADAGAFSLILPRP